MSPTGARITFVGHSTLLIEQEGVQLLTDPILRNRVYFLHRYPKQQWTQSTFDKVDAVLISHLHFDHLDLPSLHRLGLHRPLIVPAGAAQWLRRHGFSQVQELRVGEKTTVGSLTITATPADHDTHRSHFGMQIDSCVGYLIEGKQSIYFAGDTDLFDGMADLSAALDLALLPVWGWGPTLGIGHMNPQRAAQALQLLRPRYAIPIHWGTLRPVNFLLSLPPFMVQPPQEFATYAAELAPAVHVEIMPPGGTWTLPD